MNFKKLFVAIIVILILLLGINVIVQRKFIRTYTYTELEYRGYTSQDIHGIEIKHSYLNRLLSYNEWKISVEFKEVPNIFFWLTYRDNKIVFQGVSADENLSKEEILDYSEKFKNGILLDK